jgi:hypothetical protein
MKLTVPPAYKKYMLPEIDEAVIESLSKENDMTGIKRQIFLNRHKVLLSMAMRMRARQLLDRASAYILKRSMCTPSLNAILAVDENIIAVEPDNPLSLLKVIKSIVTSRCDGNIELERSHAL